MKKKRNFTASWKVFIRNDLSQILPQKKTLHLTTQSKPNANEFYLFIMIQPFYLKSKKKTIFWNWVFDMQNCLSFLFSVCVWTIILRAFMMIPSWINLIKKKYSSLYCNNLFKCMKNVRWSQPDPNHSFTQSNQESYVCITLHPLSDIKQPLTIL